MLAAYHILNLTNCARCLAIARRPRRQGPAVGFKHHDLFACSAVTFALSYYSLRRGHLTSIKGYDFARIPALQTFGEAAACASTMRRACYRKTACLPPHGRALQRLLTPLKHDTQAKMRIIVERRWQCGSLSCIMHGPDVKPNEEFPLCAWRTCCPRSWLLPSTDTRTHRSLRALAC